MEFSKYVFDKRFSPEKNLISVSGALVSLHCHHFNCGLLKAIEELKGIDGLTLFVKTTEEVYRHFFSDYLKQHPELTTPADKLQAASEMYYAFGFGKLNLSNLNEQGGTAKATSSYYVTAWLAKYGRRHTPVCYFTCGFIAGVLESVFTKPIGSYKVKETKCLITGSDFCEFEVKAI
ncbi:MAG: 4-vinyl reductase [Candidatus Desulfofervidaceae bacterium]|nr:4-vinyl reductase [Candidatus Desulfofervidaceae bacterium]MDL1971219.1 4-vinyl reductase [Candidatus Desulfofervidaceae bacterium]